VDVEALQKGWDCKAKELCLSARRPLLFFSVRSVISTPVCGENAHHVVLPAGRLVTDSPTEIHI
jgi:hypothetical protein